MYRALRRGRLGEARRGRRERRGVPEVSGTGTGRTWLTAAPAAWCRRVPGGTSAPRFMSAAENKIAPPPGGDLPWMHDDTAGDKTRRVHEPGLAAVRCLDRSCEWSGCCVSARRHLPATAPGKAPRGGFHLLRDVAQSVERRSPKPGHCAGSTPAVPASLSYRLDH